MKKQQPEENADEKMLGKVIAAELRQQLREAESDCPETEIVAAFYDRTLSDRERDVWEKHFLKCLRCQEYLAEMARLSDADEPPPLPHEAREDEAREQSGSWFYRMAWVVPFLIIGAISAIWYRDEISRYIPVQSETTAEVSEPALPEGQTPPLPKAGEEESRTKASKDLPLTAANRQVAGPGKSREDAGRPAQAAPVSTSAGQGAMAGLRDRAVLADSAGVREQAAQVDTLEKKSAAAAAIPPSPPPKPAAPAVAAEADSAAVRNEALALGGISIRGAQQKVAATWRVGRRGAIHKADGAGGWTRIASGVEDDLFDITFEGATGWAVGHGGTVLRSLDGGDSWQKVVAPTTEDLVHVSSQGSQQATVIARSGKSFSTSDGGQTWK